MLLKSICKICTIICKIICKICNIICTICTICNTIQYAEYANKYAKKICSNMQVLMFLLLIVGNMRNMQYNMQQYAKIVNTISICRICTPHFADVDWRYPVGAPPADHPSALPLLRRGVRKDSSVDRLQVGCRNPQSIQTTCGR